jgi:iron complex outermembrane receptor protein
MMQVKFKFPVRMAALIFGLFLSVGAFAQQLTVNGLVKDATGEPIIGATVRVAGSTQGAVTDIDGNFTLTVDQGTTLQVSYIGYETQEVTAAPNVVVTLQEDGAQSLNEVVVIGYGAVKKSDLTGSVAALKPDSKNKGLVVNAQDMLVGKVAGVNVTDGGGTPGGGAEIRIRGGSSLSASNKPLIVIDGIAMDNDGVKGLANPLSMVNPQDIESFNVLKDASATAIYGSRGSNGVIIITTKKGRRHTEVSYNGSITMSMKKKTIDVMDGNQYREFIKETFGEGSDAWNAMGDANTDWQDEIYRTAISHDHNVSVSGTVAEVLPYRVSFGYTNQEGILRTSDFQRYTAALNLSPSLLQDHLKINLNGKLMWAKSHYADGSAIGSALWFDPTQSPRDYTSADAANFGNYFEWKDDGTALNDPTWPNTFYSNATRNPLAILNLKNDRAISRDFVGSADVDYQIHGLEDLRLHVTAGADISSGKQATDVENSSPLAIYYGSTGNDRILKRNLQLSAYAQYFHDFNDAAKNHFDIMAGYEWQHFWRSQTNRWFSYYPATNELAGQVYTDSGVDYDGDGELESYRFKTENYLVSFFGRANWTLMDGRYMVTATVRRDGSSRFKKHYDTFPSFAFAWKINEENAFSDIKWLSDLKLRLGWGITGQQDINQGDYPYLAVYQSNSGQGSVYSVIPGTNVMVRPNAYNPDLKWEKTTTYNIGLDFGFLNQRVSGSIDWYYRKTDDLINTVNVPAGTNFRNQVISNIGSLRNMGTEVTVNWRAIETKDWHWLLSYNFTYNNNKITKLTGGDDSDYYVPTGGISSGTGNNCQAHAVGHTASSFYVYQQAYDDNGKPIEGAVVDRNADGQITPDDLYFYKSPVAPVTMGFSSRLEYKNWDFGFSLRANIGNYVFNDAAAGASNVGAGEIFAFSKYLTNRPIAAIKDGWSSYAMTSVLSDRWVQNASFLKCDNITLGYSFANLLKTQNWRGVNGRVYATCSNVFCITKYDGIDPEVFGGIDNNIYPRPISFILGVNLNF